MLNLLEKSAHSHLSVSDLTPENLLCEHHKDIKTYYLWWIHCRTSFCSWLKNQQSSIFCSMSIHLCTATDSNNGVLCFEHIDLHLNNHIPERHFLPFKYRLYPTEGIDGLAEMERASLRWVVIELLLLTHWGFMITATTDALPPLVSTTVLLCTIVLPIFFSFSVSIDRALVTQERLS